jgi:hypothetical protein
MKYIYLGALMLITSLVLTFIFFGWKLVLILVLAVQGNEIAQRANDDLNNIFNDGAGRHE